MSRECFLGLPSSADVAGPPAVAVAILVDSVGGGSQTRWRVILRRMFLMWSNTPLFGLMSMYGRCREWVEIFGAAADLGHSAHRNDPPRPPQHVLRTGGGDGAAFGTFAEVGTVSGASVRLK